MKYFHEIASRIFRYFRWTIYGFFGTVIVGILLATIMFFLTVPSIPRLPDDLNDIFGQMTQIYANGPEGNPRLVETLGGHRRVALEEIAPVFLQAIIATEDADFFDHRGVDKPGIIRAFVTNLREGRILGQGASTITQQLARHLFFTREKVWIRKIREAMASVQIETRFTKDEILSAYCNNVYFGANAYGIEEASQRFFSKHASELTLGESALLAGLVQRPSDYNPYYNMERALNRRETVFRRMKTNRYITDEEIEHAREEELTLKGTSIGPATGPYYLDYVEALLLQKYDSNLVYNGGLKVYVTMDLALQEMAEEAIKTRLAYVDSLVGDPIYELATKEEKKRSLEGALVAIDTKTGAIRALAGGRDYTSSEFNRAVENNRQPGSGFKPFVYLAALDHLGYSANTVMVDEPVSYITELGDLWEPQNFTRDNRGPVILKRAFMSSINVVSAKLASEVRPSTVVEYARRLGIKSPLQPVLSLALGSNGVSPLEMASAYSVFATGGIYHKPYVITRIEDSEGRTIEETEPLSRRVISVQSAYLLLDLLRGVILGGTGASIPYRYGFTVPSGGKTGTSNESKDVWFNGFTKDLATSVWVGYDDARPILSTEEDEQITGASGAIPVWVEFMKQATTILEQRWIEKQIAKEDSLKNLPEELWLDINEPDTGVENEEDKVEENDKVADIEDKVEENDKVADIEDKVEENDKAPPPFPMPLGIERIRVDIRTGLLSRDPVFSLPVVIRGTNPREKPQMILPSPGNSQKGMEPADLQKLPLEREQDEQIGESEKTRHNNTAEKPIKSGRIIPVVPARVPPDQSG